MFSGYVSKCNFEKGYFVTPRKPKNYGNKHPVTGYYTIKLKHKDGVWRTDYVHRCVWRSYWNKDPPRGFHVMHLDDDKSNNCLENLKLGTVSENIIQSLKNRPKHRSTRGKTKVQSKDSSGSTAIFESMSDAAKCLNVSRPTIGMVVSDKHEYRYYKHAWTPDKKEKYSFVTVK